MNATAERIAARVRALSSRERVLILGGAAAVMVFLLVRLVVDPSVAEYRRNRSDIPVRQTTLERYRLAAEGSGRVEQALAEASSRLRELEEGLLPGEDPPAAGVHLQGLLKPMVDRPDTRVTSVRALAPTEKGGYAEVAVQVDLQTTTEGLATILAAIPKSPKLLRIRKVNVHSGLFGTTMANRRETLVVSVVVSGLFRVAVGEVRTVRRDGGRA